MKKNRPINPWAKGNQIIKEKSLIDDMIDEDLLHKVLCVHLERHGSGES